MAIIRLYGHLKQFGDKFIVHADTAAEALNCLYEQINGFKKEIIDGQFRVRISGNDMNDKNLNHGLHSIMSANKKNVIHIVPAVSGAGGRLLGSLAIVAGIALVGLGVFGGFSAIVGVSLIAAGAGLMLGGLAAMLIKPPNIDGGNNGKNNNNTSFSSLDNSIAQGSGVPLCYGEVMVGSRVLSQGLQAL